jgi:hypothetical protein
VPDLDLLTAADIARLAGVTRATVSNWRRRHADFPAAVGGTEASPAYARAQVESWLAARGTLPELPLEERVWRAVRAAAGEGRSLEEAVSRVAGLVTGCGSQVELQGNLADAVRKHGRREALEALAAKYTEAAGRQAVATPPPVADLMATLAAPGGATVFDPAAGAGDLLAAAAAHGAERLIAQDTDKTLLYLARLRLDEYSTAEEIATSWGDSLRDDGFRDLRADVVLCHPPWGIQDWGSDELADDPRWRYGTPPRSEPELAWVQHALAHLRPGGRAVLLLPPAVASRPSGRRIRAELVRSGTVRAVISLPPGAVHPRHVPAHVWVLERPDGRQLVDPTLLFAETSPLGSDWERLARTAVTAWEAYRSSAKAGDGDPATWRVVAAIDLLDETVELVPARHVGEEMRFLPAADTAERIRALRARLNDELSGLSTGVPGQGWQSPQRRPRWRMATLADLGRWESVVFHRALSAAPGDNDLAEDPESGGAWPVLTVGDVLRQAPPSASVPGNAVKPEWVTVRVGDVVFPAGTAESFEARVANAQDDGAMLGRGLHLVRPDPNRVDPWFLAGFLGHPANVQRASYGSTASRIDLRRLEVPVLPLDEQQRYGAAFRELCHFTERSRAVSELTERLTEVLRESLAAGALLPSDNS